MKIQRSKSRKVIIQDNWGNAYPMGNEINFNSVEEAQTWFKNNFPTKVLRYWKQRKEIYKEPLAFPDFYIIKQIVHEEVSFRIKPHEIDENLTEKLEPNEKTGVSRSLE